MRVRKRENKAAIRLQYRETNNINKSKETQRIFVEALYKKLGLKSLNEWLNVPKYKWRENGAKDLLKYYSNDLRELLSNVYPQHSWDFKYLRKVNRFSQLESQRQFLEELFKKYGLKEMKDWIEVPRSKITSEDGGHTLLYYYYSKDYELLLRTVYPNYCWDFGTNKTKPVDYFKSLAIQREMMENLFKSFKLTTFDDWLKIPKYKIAKNAKFLLYYYNNDIVKCLTTIYPNYPILHITQKRYYPLLLQYIKKYGITEKKHWYRVPTTFHFKIIKVLQSAYPEEGWDSNVFRCKNKKSAQRTLLVVLRTILLQHDTFENYKHPSIITHLKLPMEYDIFIPSLNLAFEYQGRQHYEEIPEFFSTFQNYLEHDKMKQSLSDENSINLVYIPYWWNSSNDDNKAEEYLTSVLTLALNSHQRILQ